MSYNTRRYRKDWNRPRLYGGRLSDHSAQLREAAENFNVLTGSLRCGPVPCPCEDVCLELPGCRNEYRE